MTKILFVTTELNTVEKLRELQLSQKESLEFFFVNKSVDALKIISENNIAIIITDFRIPKFNFSEFFEILHSHYPKIFRVSLYSFKENDEVIRLSKSIHRFIKLPLNQVELLKTINDLVKLIENELDAGLIEKINSFGTIPILPGIYWRLEKEIRRSTFSMNGVAEIIQSDPLMVARLLHIAHSSYYSIPTGVNNLLQALTFLGVDIIKALVLYVKIFSIEDVSPKTRSILKEVKMHSLNVAKLSKAMMEKETSDKNMIELAYMAGLLHDIGKIVLLQLNDKQKHSSYSQKIHSFNSDEEEKKLFGVSHVNVGSYILRLWNFQDEIIDAVASHHDSSILDNKALSLKEIIFIANAFSYELEEMSLNISKSYGSEKFDQWDQLFKDDIRPALDLPI